VKTAEVWLSQGNGLFTPSGEWNHYMALGGDGTLLVPGGDE